MGRDTSTVQVPEFFREGVSLEVTEDVENPAVDRRHKRDWRYAPVVPAGTRFIVEVFATEVEEIEGVRIERQRFRISHATQSWSIYGAAVNGEVKVEEWDKEGALLLHLLPRLRERERTVDDVVTQHGWGARAFLEVLVKHGKVTVADIDDAVRLEHAEDDEDGGAE